MDAANIIVGAIAQNPEFMNNVAEVKAEADRTTDRQLMEIHHKINGFIFIILCSPVIALFGGYDTPTVFLGFLQSAVVISAGLWLIQIGLTVGAKIYNTYNLYQGIADLFIRTVLPSLTEHIMRPQQGHQFAPDVLFPEQHGDANPAEAAEVFMKVCDAFASDPVATFPLRHDDDYADLRAGELEDFAYVIDDVRNNPQTKATMRHLFAPYSPQSSPRNPFTMRTLERVRKVAVWRAPENHDNADFEQRLAEYERAMRGAAAQAQEPAQEPAPAEQVLTQAELERRLAAFRAAPAPAVPQLAAVDNLLNMLNIRT